MIKVLVADEDIKQNASCCEILSQDKDLKLISTYNGKNAIDMYQKMHPSVLILNTNISDINYNDIIKQLSILTIEKNNCNILIVANKQEDLNFINENISKVYYIFKGQVDYTNIANVLNEIKNKSEIVPLDEKTLNIFLLCLGFTMKSLGTMYFKEAIYQCYEDSFAMDSLNNIYSTLAKAHNTSAAQVKDTMRNSLIHLNLYRSMH